ncbi:MAG: YdiU family protein [Verrucomicrobiota bacterium]
MSDTEVRFGFEHSYQRLPERFYARVNPTAVKSPKLLALNRTLALELGLPLPELERDGAAFFSGNRLAADASPVALAYAGHQFGQFVPQLGDGRAILLGEVIDRNGQRRDIQLKGSGPTPFSRRGDGRAAVGPVLREYLVSEAMAALGIPTTRALAAVSTGELVYREQVLPGAIVTRVAASHIRVGTFEYFAARQDWDGIRALVDYVIERHYPEIAQAECRYLALLDKVAEKQAALVARWMHVGFVHGVMNTDNTSISGETIDYGPCAFMDVYDPETVFSSIDRSGRYAFGNQAVIAQWNVVRLAETLLPLIDSDLTRAVEQAQVVINRMVERSDFHWINGMRRKIGLVSEESGDLALVESLLDLMHAASADYTLTFRALSDVVESPGFEVPEGSVLRDLAGLERWLPNWRERLEREVLPNKDRAEAMRRVNPAVIPRNHLVESALNEAMQTGELTQFERLLDVLSRPYESRPSGDPFVSPPPLGTGRYRTFCGT